jgi:uridylate kinase
MPKNYTVLSVGGSILVPKTGFDIDFLKGFRALLLKRIKDGERFIIVIGGGATCRQYQNAAKQVVKLSNDELDWLGIAVTYTNARFVHALFADLVYEKIVMDPQVKVKTKKPLLVAAGWKPGFTTDHSAVRLAQTYGVKEVYNLSNIAYVYDKDPNKFKDAAKIEHTDWKYFCTKVIPAKRTPGMNTPFDPMASKLAKKLKLKVSFIDGRNLKALGDAFAGKKFEGTIIE